MVGRVFKRIAAPVHGLHQAAYLLAALTLASQALALLRDRAFAHVFGASQSLDVYYAAFRVPDLVFALVSSLVSAYIIIPLIASARREETERLLSESATFLVSMGGAICVALGIMMPQFLSFLYPELMASSHAGEFVLLARILLAQPILLGLSGVLSSVTQVHRRFVLFAISPLLYNLGIIAGALALYPLWGLPGIGIGVVLGAAAYLAIHIPVVAGAGVMPRLKLPTISLMAPVVATSIPRSLALSVNSLMLLALTALASRIAQGSVSVFTFASNLEAVPLALIGSSYAIAAFPALSEALENGNKKEFAKVLSIGARHIILWSMVALGIVVVLRAHVVRVILGTGAFGWGATRLTAALLAILMVGLVGDALELIFSRALYAARQSWRPLFYQLAGAGLAIVLAFLFIALPTSGFASSLAEFLKVGDVPGSRVLLLALANVIGQFVIVGLLIIGLRPLVSGLMRTLARTAVDGALAALAGGSAAYAILTIEGGIAPLTTLAAVFAQGAIAGIVGVSVAALALFYLENEEFRTVAEAVAKLARLPLDRAATLVAEAPGPEQP